MGSPSFNPNIIKSCLKPSNLGILGIFVSGCTWVYIYNASLVILTNVCLFTPSSLTSYNGVPGIEVSIRTTNPVMPAFGCSWLIISTGSYTAMLQPCSVSSRFLARKMALVFVNPASLKIFHSRFKIVKKNQKSDFVSSHSSHQR